MTKQIKCLKSEGNKTTVENLPLNKEVLVDKLISPEIEWVYSYESPLVKPLLGKDFNEWVFGACAKDYGLIHVFLDNILKAYQINGFKPVEEWFTIESSKHLVHELIHYLAPEWNESQVERATEKFMEAWLSPEKATRLIIYIGNRTFEHFLTEDNQILEVKG